jgi:hypothetical protein
MNVVTPLPIASGFPTNNVGTESARRDNVQREIIPALGQNEKSAAEKGLANEQERASSNAFNNPTYEKPSANQQATPFNPTQASIGEQANDTQQESAGKQDAKDKQSEQQEQKEIADLKARDLEVRLHEQAHAAVGGQYAGSPTYEYEKGPDGNRYAVAGEVKIDVSEAKEPEETVRKMQQVKAAALAPAEPSAQDYKVASEASQKEQAARSEMAQERVKELTESSGEQASDNDSSFEANSFEQSDTAAKTKSVIDGFYSKIGKSQQSGISLSA